MDEGIETNPEYLLNEYYGINQEQGKTVRKDLLEYFEDYIKAKSHRVGRHAVNDYHALKKHLKGFERVSRSKVEFSPLTTASARST